ncbi:hypothetical protein FNV43_RR07662 [Rhamnella rubrinervis]|uniref:Uncharacterized protein n=1 Tax=Rhamnella rubrinervis TaxID=2594499 RepID=A0A8K0MMK3_9ROSA|nr:hypothetical protein FNV43_RR07662 [Rhamnella rubrinervis]
MEEDGLLWVLNSNINAGFVRVETMNFWVKITSSQFSSISSSPLFSSIVALCVLILLYLPYQFLRIVFSPVLIITGILLVNLLRLGAIQRYEDRKQEEDDVSISCRAEPLRELSIESNESMENNDTEPEQIPGFPDEDHYWVSTQSETDSEPEMGRDSNPYFEDSFVQWNVRAPLEVIYEAYEGDEDEDDNQNEKGLNPNEKEDNGVVGLERYPSFSLYYPESDSDTSSDFDFPGSGAWDTPENMCFEWEEEDREGLIEIALDNNGNKSGMGFHVEEDNLIEIDISPQETLNPPARIVIFRQG